MPRPKSFTVGRTAITDGTEDVTNRKLQPRLIIYSDGYGVPISASPGDYVVVAGVNLPPKATERGAPTFEPRKLLCVTPEETIASLVARNYQVTHCKDNSKLKADNQPLPTFYMYRVHDDSSGNLHFSEVPPWDVWMTYDLKPPEDIDNMIAFLTRIRAQD